MAVNLTDLTIEDLRQMHDEIWTERDQYGLRRYVDYNGVLNKDGMRRSRRIYRAAEVTEYNFTVQRYDFGGLAYARCNECGHRLSFNNQVGSWARKHRAKHLGVSQYEIWTSGVDALRGRK